MNETDLIFSAFQNGNSTFKETCQMTVENQSLQTLNIIPLAGRIGAIIEGVRLSGELSSDIVQQINQAILDFKVIFFRGQQHLDDLEQESFAALLGRPFKHPTVPSPEGTNYIFELDSIGGGGRANNWHTDVTFIDAYPKMSILRGVKIPDFGGDTTWANTETAYDELPETLKALARSLRATHTNKRDYAQASLSVEDTAHQADFIKRQKVFSSIELKTEHPVVRVHPETGRLGLILGGFFEGFVGLSAKESSRLYDIFQDRIIRPENTVRWRWKEGDVAIWDNRATQHLAVNDYGDKRRIVRRVTLEGDVPVGVDGQKSKIILKEGLTNQELADAKKDAILA